MSFVPRFLRARAAGLLGKPQVRGNANWINPNFVGGPAKPHEWSKFVRQSLYTDGEKIFAFGFILISPIYVVYKVLTTNSVELRKKACNQRLNTEIFYPTVARAED
uniref:Uncharacterized protein n=1 Tax=Ciona savignyi TaxID=51511 RepID=H2YLB6_CIOSA